MKLIFSLHSAVTLAVPTSEPHLLHKRVYSTNTLSGFTKDKPQLFPPGLGAKHANRLVVIDIGANNGDAYTLQAFQKGHPVVAFEPSPFVGQLFKKVMSEHNVRLRVHNFTSDQHDDQISPDKSLELPSNTVHLIPVALSNETTFLNFHQTPCPNLQKCGKTNHLDPNSKSKASVRVPVYRLDDVPLPADPKDIWFMKIDVEGNELQMLQGARRLIREAKIPYITIEFAAHGRQGTKWGVDLLEELYLQGYSCHHLRGFGECHDHALRSPSLKCNYPFSLDDRKTAPTFKEYVETFEARSDLHKKPSLSDLMCVRHDYLADDLK
ncbi:methyltransferase FkbM [Gracilaria domingensis]|nr:methyltransferase FkbM [Gracilaria domingensis]